MKRVLVSVALVVASMAAFPLSASAANPGMMRVNGFLYTGCIANDDPTLAGLLRAGFSEADANPLVRCITGTTQLGRVHGN